ncbi:MAG: rod shape-determining protein RodA [Bacteroides sp.]
MARGKAWSRIDWGLVLLYLLLVFMGWLSIYASAYTEAHPSIFDFSQRYGQQLLWISAAFVLVVAILLIDKRFYYAFAYIIYAILLFVLLVVLFIGVAKHGARSWLDFGFFKMQPSEFAKFTTSLALARFMGRAQFSRYAMRDWLRVAVIIGIPVILILLQNDLGSAIVFSTFLLVCYREGMRGEVLLFLLFVAAIFIFELLFDKLYILLGLVLLSLVVYQLMQRNVKATLRLLFFQLLALAIGYALNFFLHKEWEWYVLSLFPALFTVLYFLVQGLLSRTRSLAILGGILAFSLFCSFSVDYVFNNVLDTHHQRRINDLLGIEDDPLGWGYNVNQSMIAIGSGGMWGKGFLEGTQTKFNFVPEQSTDFIFCTVGEEWGFAGSIVVLGLFLALLLRIILVAERQKEAFHRIYGYCVASILFFHLAINISMTIGLFPVVGIPLPFFSYGGSSLWAFTMLLFVLVKFDMDNK